MKQKIVSVADLLIQRGCRVVQIGTGLGPSEPVPARWGLAHGVFNMLHAGHLRYFQATKDHCDVLVVGITPDRFVAERQRAGGATGLARAIVPEALRAELVAALEIVDYVVIDEYPHPAPMIRALRPDVFAKGAEYEHDITPALQEAIAALAEYGGRMRFTPEDVVFSVSAFLEGA